MKLRNRLLIWLALGSAIIQIIGLAFAQPEHTPPLQVWWSPREYTLDNPVPDPWIAVLFGPAHTAIAASEIDPATVLLEGMFSPLSPPHEPYLDFRDFKLVVQFDGYDVLTAILLKLGAEWRIGPNFIRLEITGQTYEGTPFRSSGIIIMFIPRPPSP